MTHPKTTKFTIHKHLAIITLCNSEKHNAFDDLTIEDLRAHIREVRNNQNVRVLLLQAEGKHFCAGADLAWMKRMANLNYQENLEDARNLAALMSELHALAIPTVARIQGAAYGGAIGLIACCDIAIASDNSRFCLSEVKLGLAPATIGPYVVKAIGARLCRKLFLTAEVFNSQAAKEYCLIHDVVPIDALNETVHNTLFQLLNSGPMASRAAKKLIGDIEHHSAERSESSDNLSEHSTNLSEKTSELIASLRVSDEGQEGLSAFFDKRKANWCVSEDDWHRELNQIESGEQK